MTPVDMQLDVVSALREVARVVGNGGWAHESSEDPDGGRSLLHLTYLACADVSDRHVCVRLLADAAREHQKMHVDLTQMPDEQVLVMWSRRPVRDRSDIMWAVEWALERYGKLRPE